jgi:translocator protein
MLPKDPFYLALLCGALFSIVVAVAGGVLTQLTPWYYSLKQPSWKPPDWAFGPIWTIILTLVAFAAAYAWTATAPENRVMLLVVLGANGILNMVWSGLFFVMKRPALALGELVVFWFSIVAMIYVLGGASKAAGFMLVPYLVWVTIAGVLNLRIVQMNR